MLLNKFKVPESIRSVSFDLAKIFLLSFLFNSLFYLLGNFLQNFNYLLLIYLFITFFSSCFLLYFKDTLLRSSFLKKDHLELVILVFFIPFLFLIFLLTPSHLNVFGVSLKILFSFLLLLILLIPLFFFFVVNNFGLIPGRKFIPYNFQSFEDVMGVPFERSNKGIHWVFIGLSQNKDSFNLFLSSELQKRPLKDVFRTCLGYLNSRCGYQIPFKDVDWVFKKTLDDRNFLNPEKTIRENYLRFKTPKSNDLNIDKAELPQGFKTVKIYVEGKFLTDEKH